MAGTTSTIPITIGTTLIQMPNSGASPIWSQAIIQFVQAVELALQSSSSPFNISPSVMTLASNTNTDIPLTGTGAPISFPNGSVRGFVFFYDIYRYTSSTSTVQQGQVSGIFNSSTSTWELQHEFSGDVQANGQPYSTFDMNSSDQLLLTTVPLSSGTYNAASTISYYATTNLVTST